MGRSDINLYFETGSIDPYYNLAFEEYVFENYREGMCLILWQNDNTIVIGKNQVTEQEINASFVREHNINVVRRMTGGGAVYHDMGNLNYSFMSDADSASSVTINHLAKPVVDALKSFGAEASVSGRNDIVIDGLKVSGTAQRLLNGRILHHGTLLFDSNAEMIVNSLKPHKEKLESKGIRSVKSRIGNIKDFVPSIITTGDFFDQLRETLLSQGYIKKELSEEELEMVNKLADTKYRTWQWNYGKNPTYETEHTRRFDGGYISVGYRALKGMISDISFHGDFLAMKPLSEVESILKGCPLTAPDIINTLCDINLKDYFGTITADEIVCTILGL